MAQGIRWFPLNAGRERSKAARHGQTCAALRRQEAGWSETIFKIKGRHAARTSRPDGTGSCLWVGADAMGLASATLGSAALSARAGKTVEVTQKIALLFKLIPVIAPLRNHGESIRPSRVARRSLGASRAHWLSE